MKLKKRERSLYRHCLSNLIPSMKKMTGIEMDPEYFRIASELIDATKLGKQV